MIKEVLKRITYTAGLRINFKKSKFFQNEARILGSIVSRTGLKMDPKKIKSIINWPKPKDGEKMQRFMGAANFNRDYTHIFAKTAAPLDEFRNAKHIEWTPERDKAFEDLKNIFKQNLELQYINWDNRINLTTDACVEGIGAWIGQVNKLGE